jgi:hypothetical protein
MECKLKHLIFVDSEFAINAQSAFHEIDEN